MAIAALASAVRPILVQGAKEGAKAIVSVAVVYGSIGAIAGVGYGAYRGGRKVADKVRSWRQARRDAKAPNTAEVVDLNGVPVAEAA